MIQGQASLRQTDRQSRDQDKSTRRSERGHRSDAHGKTSMAQLAAAAELFSSGKAGRHTKEAASRFGNQAMLRMAESSSALKSGINASAGVLTGEAPPAFVSGAPVSEIQPQLPLTESTPPVFSANAPAADIQSIAAAAESFL